MEHGSQLVQALVFGRLEGLAPETIFLYGRTGLIHLFSASGFHMGSALLLARIFSRWGLGHLPWPRAKAILSFGLSLVLMTYFGQATEWSSPLVRAYAFTTLLSFAALLEVRPSLPWIFLLSLLASALCGRSSFLSFLLSALGMAGVLCAGRRLLWIALLPWIFTLPVVTYVFGLFSLAAPFWNLTFGVLIGCTVLPLAILDLLAGSLGLPRTLGQLAAFVMEWLHRGLAWGDAKVGLAYWVPFFPFVLLSLLFLGLAPWRPRWLATGLAALAVAAASLAPRAYLIALNVGQGDALWLRLESASTLLVDGGPNGPKYREAPVNRALERNAIGAVDHALITHADRDHSGGLPSLLARHRVKEALWVREVFLYDPRALPALAAAERAGVKIRLLTETEAPPDLRCWLPPATNANESSPLCHAQLQRGQSIWLTGDAGFTSERWLLAREARIPPATLLKLGHHGSRHSSSPEFLRASGAQAGIVSAGRKNRYGHPAGETLERLRSAGIQCRRTDFEGDVKLY